MLQTELLRAKRPSRQLHVGLATCETEILAAQKLRYQVFAEEMGARLSTRTPGVDRDIYDPFCEHLIVRDEEAGQVVGTYRILSPDAARRVGGYYSENEFDLTRLQHLRPRLVEGREDNFKITTQADLARFEFELSRRGHGRER